MTGETPSYSEQIETDLEQYNTEVGEWAEENFGEEQPAYVPLMGIGEELGEYVTSVLKQLQGIDDHEKYQNRTGTEHEMDALGDASVYLMDYTYRDAGVTIDEVIHHLGEHEIITTEMMKDAAEYAEIDEASMGVFGLYFAYYEVVRAVIDEINGWSSNKSKHVAEMLAAIEFAASTREFTLDDAIEEAWGEVQHREWDADVQV